MRLFVTLFKKLFIHMYIMKYILPVVLFLFIKFASSDISYDVVREEWNLFKVQHFKKYAGSVEESYRFKIFVENLKKIYKHNQRYELGATLYKMDVNEFADMFEHEVLESRCGINGSTLSLNPTIGATFIPPANINIPTNFDWVKLGAVTEVKNQGKCGSCWAFSATGSLEGQNFRASKKLVSLSEQNLLDCSRSYGNHGCKGGLMENAFRYILHNNGIDTEEKYPYEGKDVMQCRYNPKFKEATIKGFVNLPKGSEDSLLKAVATISPISVAIEATSQFVFYKSGIFYDSECSTSSFSVNHAVLIVGYGVDNATGANYWLVKNSWGPEWGDKGYIKMSRNKRNNCNIATYGIYPIV